MFNVLKDTIRSSLVPFVKWIPLSPNHLTIIGLLISFWAAVVFSSGDLVKGGILILLSGLFDILDGAVARANNSMTPFGAVLDSVCDRYADAIVFTGIAYGLVLGNIAQSTILTVPLWLWAVFAIIGSYLVSYVRSRAESAGAVHMSIGIAERPERMIILVAGAMMGFLAEAILVIVVLTHITIIQRLYHAKKALS